MILLVGGTGTVGSEVARLLAGRDGVRGLARSDESAERLAELGVEPVRGDLVEPGSLPAAFEGARRLLLVTPWSPAQAELEGNAIDAAAAAGVERIVKLAVLDAAPGREVAMTRTHREVERRLAESGIPRTVLRADWFANNYLEQIEIIRGGLIAFPYADAPSAAVDARDVAEVAAAALTADEPQPELLELTGPETLTFRESADRIAAATGRPLELIEADPADWKGGLVAFGIEEAHADALLELIAGYAERGGDQVRDGVERSLGRPPRSFDDFLRDELVPALEVVGPSA
ncbi:MAG TPA: NmrA family NAD(P)-binding protein [Thermoleophilaceae bacterium]|jgi:uncharacterized protein YbjT (DUF2867 family)